MIFGGKEDTIYVKRTYAPFEVVKDCYIIDNRDIILCSTYKVHTYCIVKFKSTL